MGYVDDIMGDSAGSLLDAFGDPVQLRSRDGTTKSAVAIFTFVPANLIDGIDQSRVSAVDVEIADSDVTNGLVVGADSITIPARFGGAADRYYPITMLLSHSGGFWRVRVHFVPGK